MSENGVERRKPEARERFLSEGASEKERKLLLSFAQQHWGVLFKYAYFGIYPEVNIQEEYGIITVKYGPYSALETYRLNDKGVWVQFGLPHYKSKTSY